MDRRRIGFQSLYRFCPDDARTGLVMGMFFDDVRVGQVFESAQHTVQRSDILDFARAYDPNVFHLDPDAARSIGLRDIIASGFHTLSLSFRLFFEIHPWDEAVLPSPGIDKVRFLTPIYPDDRVFVRATVLEAIPSSSKPDRGMVRLSHETLNAISHVPVLTAEALHRLRRKGDRG